MIIVRSSPPKIIGLIGYLSSFPFSSFFTFSGTITVLNAAWQAVFVAFSIALENSLNFPAVISLSP